MNALSCDKCIPTALCWRWTAGADYQGAALSWAFLEVFISLLSLGVLAQSHMKEDERDCKSTVEGDFLKNFFCPPRK